MTINVDELAFSAYLSAIPLKVGFFVLDKLSLRLQKDCRVAEASRNDLVDALSLIPPTNPIIKPKS